MAEVLFEEIVRKEGEAEDWWIDSAGVSAFDGEQATNNTQVVATERGLDLSSHRSKFSSRDVVEPFSLVLVMEERHRTMLLEAFPELSERVYLLKQMTGETDDVHDPIGTDIANYRNMADEVNSTLTQGLDRIRELADDANKEAGTDA
jgi:protein-tyrosine-phosphatase